MRLLAVDDDPVILELLPVIFKEANLPDMDLASSAEAALEVLRHPENHYDCLVFDIQMAEMDGVELCRQVREFPHHHHTPILMLTSVTDHTQIEDAFAAGANDYITKPFEVKEVATRVRVAQRMFNQTGPVAWLDSSVVNEGAEMGIHSFAIEDPIRLVNAKHLILPFSLGNYLSQLSRRRLDTCSIFAVKIEEIGKLYATCKDHEFARALCAVISSVNTVVNTPSLLMAYEGDGMFLCITQDSASLQWPEIEDRIQDILLEKGCSYDDGSAMPVSVSVGNPVAPNASRTQRVKKTFDRARHRALTREKTKVKNAPKGSMSQMSGPQTFHIN